MAEASAYPGFAAAFSSSTSNDSTIRILLLGRCGSGKSSSGNTILGKKAFKGPKHHKEEVVRTSEEQSSDVGGWKVCVIKTPDLLDPDLSENQLNQEKEKLVSLCQSGLHAVLLVLPIGEDLQNEAEMLEFIKELLGPDIQRYTIMLFTRGDELEDDETIERLIKKEGLQQLMDRCHGYHVFNNAQRVQGQVDQLLDKINTLVQRNGGRFFKSQWRRKSLDWLEKFLGEPEGSSDILHQLMGKNQRRLILVGKTGVGKSATGNTILGRKEFASDVSSSSQTTGCCSQKAERAGKEIILIDTPGLFDTTLSQEDVIKEIFKCMTYACPGPHAFIIVIKIGRFTPEEKETVNHLKDAFGANAQKYTMILFTCKDELDKKKQTIEQYLENGDPELKALVESCGNRFYCLNNNTPNYKQFKDVMDKIDSMVAENEGNFCNNDFLDLDQSIREIQNEKMAEKVKNYNKEEIPQSEWKKIYWRLLEESRYEAEQVLISEMCIGAIGKMFGKLRVTPEERESAIKEAQSKSVHRQKAIRAVIRATRELARQKMCAVQ